MLLRRKHRNIFVAGISVIMLAGLGATAAYAQQDAAIAGLVSDTTAGVMPGVTVEARSAALIEGVRTAFTDGAGRYTIVNLPPGNYSVTFTLPGFNTILREGVESDLRLHGHHQRGAAGRRPRRNDYGYREQVPRSTCSGPRSSSSSPTTCWRPCRPAR